MFVDVACRLKWFVPRMPRMIKGIGPSVGRGEIPKRLGKSSGKDVLAGRPSLNATAKLTNVDTKSINILRIGAGMGYTGRREDSLLRKGVKCPIRLPKGKGDETLSEPHCGPLRSINAEKGSRRIGGE